MPADDEIKAQKAAEEAKIKAGPDATAEADAKAKAEAVAKEAEKPKADEEQRLRGRVAELEAELAERNQPAPDSKNPNGTITLNAKNQVVGE